MREDDGSSFCGCVMSSGDGRATVVGTWLASAAKSMHLLSLACKGITSVLFRNLAYESAKTTSVSQNADLVSLQPTAPPPLNKCSVPIAALLVAHSRYCPTLFHYSLERVYTRFCCNTYSAPIAALPVAHSRYCPLPSFTTA